MGTHEDHIIEASHPVALQEVDASTPLTALDPLHAVTGIFSPSPAYVCKDIDHLQHLLKIIKEALPHPWGDVVYRVWMAYCAGYTGRRCLTCSITQLDYWYTVGRLLRQKHDAPGMVKR